MSSPQPSRPACMESRRRRSATPFERRNKAAGCPGAKPLTGTATGCRTAAMPTRKRLSFFGPWPTETGHDGIPCPSGSGPSPRPSGCQPPAIRRSETVAVCLEDLDPETGAIRVIGKGNREQTVYAPGAPGRRSIQVPLEAFVVRGDSAVPDADSIASPACGQITRPRPTLNGMTRSHRFSE